MRIRLLIFILIVSSPFLTMVIVNECFDTPKRTDKYLSEHCTWYCHNVTCKHWENAYKQNPTKVKKMHKDIFDWYVNSLHGNSLGLNYRFINLLIFILGYPVAGGLLVWNLIKRIK